MSNKDQDKNQKTGFGAFLKCCMKPTPKTTSPSKVNPPVKTIQKTLVVE
jgi:hypothetical protein